MHIRTLICITYNRIVSIPIHCVNNFKLLWECKAHTKTGAHRFHVHLKVFYTLFAEEKNYLFANYLAVIKVIKP